MEDKKEKGGNGEEDLDEEEEDIKEDNKEDLLYMLQPPQNQLRIFSSVFSLYELSTSTLFKLSQLMTLTLLLERTIRTILKLQRILHNKVNASCWASLTFDFICTSRLADMKMQAMKIPITLKSSANAEMQVKALIDSEAQGRFIDQRKV